MRYASWYAFKASLNKLPISIRSACTQLSLVDLLCFSQTETLCYSLNKSCKGATTWLNDAKKQNKVNKVGEKWKRGINHGGGSTSLQRTEWERIFLWMDRDRLQFFHRAAPRCVWLWFRFSSYMTISERGQWDRASLNRWMDWLDLIAQSPWLHIQ